MSRLVQSKELFINMKNAPKYNPKLDFFDQKKDTLDFYTEEHKKITKGITLGGYFLHPWLYYHINYFKTPIPQEDGTEKVTTPPLDDCAFYTTETYKEAEDNDLGIGLFGARGFSKALRNSEPILYKDKTWRPIGEAKIGDKIFGADGKITRIENVSPQGTVELFKVTLRDGRTIECCGDHLWEVYDMQARRHKTLPLKEILRAYKYNRKYTGSKYADGKGRIAEVYNYYIPTNKCMEFSKVDLPLDPYFVGLWLGDGTCGKPQITTADYEIELFLEEYALELGLTISRGDRYQVNLVGKKKRPNPISVILRELGVFSKKAIPEIYLKGSESQRMELLRGLLDSDGTIDKTGNNISFVQANLAMCEQVRELCHSLGINCSITELDVQYIRKDGEKSVAWRVTMYTKKPVFKLTRKLDRISNSEDKGKSFRSSHNAIVDIQPSGKNLATCIRVDNKDKLFVTRDYIVTHNSSLITSLNSWLATTKPNGTTSIIGGSAGDLGAISALMQTTFTNMHPAFKIPRLVTKWDSNIEFGVKQKNNEKLIHSRISITNAAKGSAKESEKGAGLSPVGFTVDELGKFSSSKLLLSAIPSFMTPNGAKLVHLVAGTGGNEELSKDAQGILENPAEYRLLPMDFKRLEHGVPDGMITWKESYKDTFCTYVPAQMSYRLKAKKVQSNMSEYLDIKNEHLAKIKINVTDWKKAKEVLDEMESGLKKEEARNKHRMYYPTKISDCFLTNTVNPFPVGRINKRIKELEEEGRIGKDIEIYKDGKGNAKYDLISKKRAKHDHSEGNIDAPIILYGELPETPPPTHTNVMGHDGYKLDSAKQASLGTFYVLRRRNLAPDQPCETIQASYSGRPDTMLDFLAEGTTMAKTFNAMCCMESLDMAFKHHLQRTDDHYKYLAKSFSFSSASPTGEFGLYPSKGNNTVRFNLLVAYTKEEHTMGIDADGNTIIKYGVDFIDDIDLLREMANYKVGGNFDRIDGFSYALVYARELDKAGIQPKEDTKPVDKHKDQKRIRLTSSNNRYGNIKMKKF